MPIFVKICRAEQKHAIFWDRHRARFPKKTKAQKHIEMKQRCARDIFSDLQIRVIWKLYFSTFSFAKNIPPFFHSFFLMRMVLLAIAWWNVSITPFWKSGEDLFHSDTWIFTIVTIKIETSSFATIFRATMWKDTEIFFWQNIQANDSYHMIPTIWIKRIKNLLFVIETTALISSCKTFFHSSCIICKLIGPSIDPFIGLVIESAGMKNFTGKLNKPIESLKWVTWWNFLLVSKSLTNQKKSGRKFHFNFFINSYRMKIMKILIKEFVL